MYKQKHSDRICTFPGCGRMYYAKGLCWAHYEMHLVRKHPLRSIYTKTNPKPKTICRHAGCAEIAHNKGLCDKHARRFTKYGDTSVIHTRGRKSIFGHQTYPNHSLMKRNRLIRLELNPICQHCGSEPSVMVHHIDFTKTNHDVDNLLALCSAKCHKYYHMKSTNRNETRFTNNGFLTRDEFSRKEVEDMFNRDQKRKFDISKEKIYNIVCRKRNIGFMSISQENAKVAIKTSGNM